MIVDDARVSRLICNVAERFDLACLAINKTDDIPATYEKFTPDVVLLDPEPLDSQGKNVLRKLAQRQTGAAIVMTSPNRDQTRHLEELSDSLGLNLVGVLPDVFDADTLTQQLSTILGQQGDTPGGITTVNGNES